MAEDKSNGRSQEEILLQAPIKVTLGGKLYEIRPLTINEAVKWREQMFRRLKDFSRSFEPPKKSPLLFWRRRNETAEFVDALQASFLGIPRMAADLFFSYARELPRAEIEAHATEAELVKALGEVWKVAFPFAEMLQLAAQLTGLPASAKPTNSPSASGGLPPSI